ncbi:MAG: cysteine-rich KTR domain-containing protein [Monoglobales bacterium]
MCLENNWIKCPICKQKTRIKLCKNTFSFALPLFPAIQN